MDTYHVHDLVAILKKIESPRLKKGQVGTIVEILEVDRVFLVEFSNDKGEAISLIPLHKNDFLLIHLNPELAS